MKFLAILSAVLILHVSTPLAESGADYYPLREGYSWVYSRTTGAGKGVAPEVITRTVDAYSIGQGNGEARVRLDDGAGGVSYIWLNRETRGGTYLTAMSGGPNREQASVNLTPPVALMPRDVTGRGTIWETKIDIAPGVSVTSRSTVEATGETVRVAAGVFRNCLKVRGVTIDESGRELDVTYSWYARGVGEVLTEQTEPAGRRFRSELTGYTVKQQ